MSLLLRPKSIIGAYVKISLSLVKILVKLIERNINVWVGVVRNFATMPNVLEPLMESDI